MATPPRQLELTLKSIELLDPGQKITGPPNVIYSCNPRIAGGLDNFGYVLKGPDIEIVAAEACAHLLAQAVELPVPEFGVAPIDGNMYFASREVQIRNVQRFLAARKIQNPATLYETIAFDVWVANTDRNLGNFVGEMAANEGAVRIVPIDFEKSATIRERTPIVSVPLIEPRRLWPHDDLGRIACGGQIPDAFCEKIAALPRARIDHAMQVATAHLPAFTWGDNSAQVLEVRARRIRQLCREVWR